MEQFDAYLNKQIDKVDLPDITPEERTFMIDAVTDMYANPLKNYLKATEP